MDFDFKIEDMPVSSTYGPLAPGWYDASIVSAELVVTKAGDGQYLKVRFQLENKRNVFSNITTRNPSPQAESIGRQQIGDIMRSAGIPRLREPNDLLGASMQIKLDIQPASDRYEASNVVRGYKPLKAVTSALPTLASASTPNEQIAVNTKKSTPPWVKK